MKRFLGAAVIFLAASAFFPDDSPQSYAFVWLAGIAFCICILKAISPLKR